MADKGEQVRPLVAGTPVVDPGPGQRTNTIGHPVEHMLHASARDILDALENGFRARADLKGKLAELFMSRHLDDLVRRGAVVRYTWRDMDDVPDFLIELPDGTTRTLEVKNVRSGTGRLRVETQKTRNSSGDPWNRRYRVDKFDLVAACLFNATSRWEYVFARAADLSRHAQDERYLATMQDVVLDAEPRPGAVTASWRGQLVEVLP